MLRLVNSLRIFYRWRNQNKKKAYFLLQKDEEFDIWPILPKLDRGFKDHQQISEGSEVAYDFKTGTVVV